VGLHLDLFAGHAVCQLLLVVFEDFLALAPLVAIARHHRVENHLSPPATDEQLERSILVLFQFEVASRELLKEVIDSASLFLLLAIVGLGARPALNNGQEFSKLNFLWAILIYKLNNLLDLLSVFNEAERNQRVLQFVDTDRTRVIVIQTVEVLAKLLQFFVLENDAVVFPVLAEPWPLLTFGVELQRVKKP
jgi:hypothetical protein